MQSGLKLFALIIFLSLCACKKENSPLAYSMAATVDGSQFTSSNVTVDYRNDILQIIGSTSTEELSFILEYKGAGTYPITLTWDAENLAEFKHGGASYNAVGGQLVLTSTSPQLKGTFNLILDDGSKITEGSFTAQGL